MKIRFATRPERPDEQRGMKIPYPPERRKPPLWRWYALLFLFLSPVIYFAWTLLVPHLGVQAPGFVRMPVYTVVAPEAGRIAGLEVREGARRRKGEPLFRLENPLLEASIDALEREIATLVALKKRQSNRKRAMLRSRLASLAQEIARERKRLETYERLLREGAVTFDEVNRRRSRLETLEAERSELLYELRTLPAGSDGGEEAADARIAALRNELTRLQERSKLLALRAPATGRVSDVTVRPNLYVERGTHLLDIVEEENLSVQAFFEPKAFDRLARGTPAIVKFADGKRFDAVIDEEPVVSSRLPGDFSLLKENKRAVPVRLRFVVPPPPRYRIANMPVTVYLKTPAAEWISGL